jgi:hypothetical protein
VCSLIIILNNDGQSHAGLSKRFFMDIHTAADQQQIFFHSLCVPSAEIEVDKNCEKEECWLEAGSYYMGQRGCFHVSYISFQPQQQIQHPYIVIHLPVRIKFTACTANSQPIGVSNDEFQPNHAGESSGCRSICIALVVGASVSLILSLMSPPALT